MPLSLQQYLFYGVVRAEKRNQVTGSHEPSNLNPKQGDQLGTPTPPKRTVVNEPQYKGVKPKKNHPWKAHNPGLFSRTNTDLNKTPYAAGSMKKNKAR